MKRKSNNYIHIGLSVQQELWTDYTQEKTTIVCTHDGLTWMWFHFYLFDILYYSTVSWSEDQLLLQLLNKWYEIINQLSRRLFQRDLLAAPYPKKNTNTREETLGKCGHEDLINCKGPIQTSLAYLNTPD